MSQIESDFNLVRVPSAYTLRRVDVSKQYTYRSPRSELTFVFGEMCLRIVRLLVGRNNSFSEFVGTLSCGYTDEVFDNENCRRE